LSGLIKPLPLFVFDKTSFLSTEIVKGKIQLFKNTYSSKNKAVREVDQFNRLVSEQMVTMEKLLFLQGELERCQLIEEELQTLQNETNLESIQSDIKSMKKELKEIQQIFETQTEELINSYREMNLTPSL
jgi:hypothetical protein